MTEVTEAAVKAAIAEHARLLVDRPDPMVLSDAALFRRVLEAALPHLAESRPASRPQAALDDGRPVLDDPEIKALIAAPGIPKSGRSEAILMILNAAGRAGWTNHQILELGSELSDRWGKHPSGNLYQHWNRLLQMLRNVRSHYPDPHRKGAAS